MNEVIAQEKSRIQNLFRLFNQNGCRMQVREHGGENFIDTIIAEWIVTRIAPHFDTAGKITRVDFWVVWKELGYSEDRRCCHTTKIIGVDVDDTLPAEIDGQTIDAWLIVELIDERKRIHHIEMIEPVTEPDHAADWKQWTQYRTDHPNLFKRIDESVLEEHLEMAEEWE
jgi:hypothetical protein